MGTGKKKIEIKMIEKRERRMVTFTKRRKGLFKKAHQLHCLTGANIAVVVFSPAGRPYVHCEPSFDVTIDHYMSSSSSSPSTSSSVEEIKGSDGSGNGGDGGEKLAMLRSCLDSMRVEDYWNVEELVLMKEKMEKIREKVVYQMDNAFVNSFFSF